MSHKKLRPFIVSVRIRLLSPICQFSGEVYISRILSKYSIITKIKIK